MLGTWRLNVAKSTFPPTEVATKEETVFWRGLGADQYEFTITSVRVDGSPSSMKGTMPSTGGVVNVQQPIQAKGESGIITVVGPGDWYVTVMQNGKQVEVIHSVVSKDGKTCRNTTKGTNAKGKPYESLELYERQ